MHPSHKLDTVLTLTKDGLQGHLCVKCGWSNTPPLLTGLDFECSVTNEQYEATLKKRGAVTSRWGH